VIEISTTTKKNKKRPTKIQLSDEQTKVKDMVVKDGLNVFFTGSAGQSRPDRHHERVRNPTVAAYIPLPTGRLLTYFCGLVRPRLAGTGKSVLLREIIKGLREKYRARPDAVAVTASTGIAACNVGGTTLHSFAGIGLGIEPADQL
jgi:hypothetical protein